MNILPKKRWHVRTKQNIERVRRDEAEARDKELREKRRSQAAEREARIEVLRHKKFKSADDASHENGEGILGDLEKCLGGTNKEHDDELRAEKEKIEKNIGLLTYLGQSASDAQKPWYLDPRSNRAVTNDEKSKDKDKASKSCFDPLNEMKKYLSLKKKMHSSVGKDIGKKKLSAKDSASKSCVVQKKKPGSVGESSEKGADGTKSIEALRAARLERERIEREKASLLMKKHKPSFTY